MSAIAGFILICSCYARRGDAPSPANITNSHACLNSRARATFSLIATESGGNREHGDIRETQTWVSYLCRTFQNFTNTTFILYTGQEGNG